MTLYFLLILIAIAFSVLFAKRTYELNALKKYSSEIERELIAQKKGQEEFSLELTKVNGEAVLPISSDSLTALPGRQAFEDRLSQAIIQSKRFEKSLGVMFLDIDQFNVINQTYGHDIGDILLREVAKRLKLAIRQVDTVTRYAGDNFVFLLPQLSTPETAVYVAQRLLDAIVQPFLIDGKELSITSTIGIAIYPSDGEDVQTLLRNSDYALKQAKSYGKNLYQFYHQELHALGQRELMLNSCISGPDFLQKLLIDYQPQMNVKTKEIVGVEAVLYLQHPDLGLVAFS